MDKIQEEINKVIKHAFENFCDKICERYPETEIDVLEELWNESCDDIKISVKGKKPATSQTRFEYSKSTCPHLMTRGKRTGEDCGEKVRLGRVYCTKHKKYEDDDNMSVASDISTISELSQSTSSEVVLRRNKDLNNKLWHPKTTFVFNSNKQVIGKYNGKNIVPLSDFDISTTCKEYKFRIAIDED